MRRFSWCVAALVLAAVALVSSPAGASSPQRCGEAVPTSTYDAAHRTVTLTEPMAACSPHGHVITMALTLSSTRCQPVVGCDFPVNARKQCRARRGSCVLVVHAPHPAVEIASYYTQANMTVFDGDEVRQSTVAEVRGLPCTSAVVTTAPTC